MKLVKLLFLCGVIISQYAHAQSSQEELSKEAANPLADLMSFPFQNNLNMNYGPYNRNMNVLNIQPVLPFAGEPERDDVNHMLLNLFIVRQLGNGWYVNSAPIFTANWMAASGQKWIVPVGAGGGKLVFLGGKLPLNLQTQLYYNVVRPDFGPEWQWRFQAQILLPKSIFKRT